MGSCSRAEVERNVVAVSRVHGAVIRERAPNPHDACAGSCLRGVAKHVFRGWGEEHSSGRDRVLGMECKVVRRLRRRCASVFA